MSLLFKSPVDIEIRLDTEGDRSHLEVKRGNGRMEPVPLYKDGETVKGYVTVRPREGKKVDHIGVKVQLLGAIELKVDTVASSLFLLLATELAAPGQLKAPETYPFEFRNVEKPHESYRGKNIALRYYVLVVVSRKNKSPVSREKELWVHQYTEESQELAPTTVKMDVGIELCLHIEFEYLKSRYGLKDVIVGRVYFLLVRLKIKHVEVSLIRREIVGLPPDQVSDLETLVRYEIMDGAPVKGETVPFRMFLNGYDLTPTHKDVNKKFSTRTYLSLVLIDEDGRRYFKQSEIILYREAQKKENVQEL